MADSQARAMVSLSTGTIELEGPDTFVSQQLERFDAVIKEALQASLMAREERIKTQHTPDESKTPSLTRPNVGGATELSQYENLYALADDRIQVLKDLPGSSKAEKTVSAALLLTYANQLNGTETTTFDAIRDLCEAHGALDSGNFAKALRAEKEAFVFGGTTRKVTVKLTVPGRKRAEQMARELNGA